jgi:hypothetical protein
VNSYPTGIFITIASSLTYFSVSRMPIAYTFHSLSLIHHPFVHCCSAHTLAPVYALFAVSFRIAIPDTHCSPPNLLGLSPLLSCFLVASRHHRLLSWISVCHVIAALVTLPRTTHLSLSSLSMSLVQINTLMEYISMFSSDSSACVWSELHEARNKALYYMSALYDILGAMTYTLYALTATEAVKY